MKKILVVLLCAMVSMGAMAQKAKSKGPQKEKVTFKVEMDCPSCKAAIEKAIPFEKGVKDLEVDFEAGKVTITFDPSKTTKANLIKALNSVDKEVRVVGEPACCGEKKCDKPCAEKPCAEKKECCGEKKCDKPCADKPCAEKKECCGEKKCDKPCAEKPCADKPCAEKKECPAKK